MLNLIERAQAAIIISPLSPLPRGDINVLVTRIVSWVLWIAGTLAVIYLIYGGILYITAGGDAEKATKGRTALINAIIGIIIILLSMLIVGYVEKVLTTAA